MAAYEDQEELEKLKAWWKNYGNSVIFGIALGAAVLVGFRYWTQHKEAQRHAAVALYEQLFQSLSAGKGGEARKLGETLMSEYDSTPYAGMAGLLLARMDFEAGDAKSARERLQWVLQHAGDDATRHTARLRLARIHLNAGERDAALALLDVGDRAGFEGEYAELKGDILAAQGKGAEARVAYREALAHLPPGSPYVSMLQMKLDDLGPEPVP